MTIRRFVTATLALVAILPFTSPFVRAQAMTVSENEVWKMEELYQKFWNDVNDIDGYMELWHDDYLGWLGGYKTPVNKAGIRDFYRRGMIDSWTTTEFKNEGIKRFGNTAETFYSISGYRGKEKSGEVGNWWRVTHYWIKESGRWQIIGGMSAPLD